MDLKHLSSESKAKLAQLRKAAEGIRLFRRIDPNISHLLKELGEAREPAVMLDLLDYTLHTDAGIRDAARGAVNKLVVLLPQEQLPELDIRMRAMGGFWLKSNTPWDTLQPGRITGFVEEPYGLLMLALSSMHNNGRVREAALSNLSACRDGFELPYFLLRLNDWVDAIRIAARHEVRVRIVPEYAEHFLRQLGLVMRLEHCGRDDHGWLLKDVGKLLSRNECEQVLRNGLVAPDRVTRRTCLRLAVDANGAISDSAIRGALSDRDPMIRLWATKQLLQISDRKKIGSIHARLASDPFMPIRREVLQALVVCDALAARPALYDALLDRNSSMREVARYYLQKYADFDAADFYRKAMESSDGQKLVVAIRGLGEAGRVADSPVVASYLSSLETAIRRAAVASLGQLDARKHMDALFECIADPSPGVSREATRALLPVAVELDRVRLKISLLENPIPHARKNALYIVLRLGKWEQLPLILAACRDSSEHVARLACVAVNRWLARYNHVFVAPGSVQVEAVDRELRQSQEFLASGEVANLFALLAEWRGKAK